MFTKPYYLSITYNEILQNSKSEPKNSHSCIPFKMSTFSFLHAYLYYMSLAIARGMGEGGIGGVLQHVGLIF
jgi:hypothetical protein